MKMRKQQQQQAQNPAVNGYPCTGPDAYSRLTSDTSEQDRPEPRPPYPATPTDQTVQPTSFRQFLKDRLPRYKAPSKLSERIRKAISDMQD